MTCTVDGCARRIKCKGLCGMHYQRARNSGDVGQAGPLSRRGPANGNWKGGRSKAGESGRYWKVRAPGHPHADRHGYVLEHRLVMERQLGRLLHPHEIVHHLNDDPRDNRPENLAVMTQSEHIREHKPRLGTGRKSA